jgi:hypothetical protein
MALYLAWIGEELGSSVCVWVSGWVDGWMDRHMMKYEACLNLDTTFSLLMWVCLKMGYTGSSLLSSLCSSLCKVAKWMVTLFSDTHPCICIYTYIYIHTCTSGKSHNDLTATSLEMIGLFLVDLSRNGMKLVLQIGELIFISGVYLLYMFHLYDGPLMPDQDRRLALQSWPLGFVGATKSWSIPTGKNNIPSGKLT